METSACAVEIITDKTILDIITDITDDPEQEEAFFVADLSQIIHRFKFWQTKMDGIRLLFPLRYNNDPKVIVTLGALGVNFSCASKMEIENVSRAGIDPSRIFYCNRCKSPKSLTFAAECGVKWLFFDNKYELQKIKRIHPAAELILPIDIYSSGPKIAIKSGHVGLDQVSSLLQEAKDLQLQVVGVSFYIENIEEVEEFTNAILILNRVFSTGKNLGFNFYLLHLDTEFPSKIKNLEIKFNEISSIIGDVLDHHFLPSNEVQIVANPGRFLVSSSFVLCANIIAKREMETATENGKMLKEYHYYVSDGIFGSFSDVIYYYETTYYPIAIKRNHSNTVHRSVVWGPTCCSKDKIVECSLPNLSVGDWLMFRDMGAYSFTRNTSFNGFNTPKVKYILPFQALKYLQNLPNWSEIRRRLNISL
ncbi:ornithine decarboxylase-like [Centruroides sculpturatus]|uniref:ornithine decarboxylase-like n=1 Tax=Centruroides sculpturatus TaxID=218467 RepID=UPI000C6EED33|nr:ornithine decarboxylase-like [Centruroides sculpturatus]